MIGADPWKGLSARFISALLVARPQAQSPRLPPDADVRIPSHFATAFRRVVGGDAEVLSPIDP